MDTYAGASAPAFFIFNIPKSSYEVPKIIAIKRIKTHKNAISKASILQFRIVRVASAQH